MLIPLLQSAADEAPTAPFLITRDGARSYADLLAESQRVAAVLEKRALGRFACHLTNATNVLTLWFAAAWIGTEPCVLARDVATPELEDLAAHLGFEAIVADAPPEGRVGPWIAAGDLFQRTSEIQASPERPYAPDPSIVILTTGTTGRPKAARYLWSSLVAQVRRTPGGGAARWLLAYDLNHFAGVQMFLHALVNRASLAIPPALRPSEALAAIEEFGVTHVSATPTFWRVLLAQLSRERARRVALEQITLGAEPVPQGLVEQLRESFPGARVSQVFAATEVGTCLATSDGRAGLPASILDRDEGADVQFRVVDGELYIKARHGMLGYVGGDESPAGEWRATGDMVERRGDRLHFVGRKSETINVGGVKVHPLPIEERVQSLAGVRLARAYGKRNPIAGEIVALDVAAADGVDLKELETQIRSACGSLPPAARPRLVRFVDALETRNQKLVRRRS